MSTIRWHHNRSRVITVGDPHNKVGRSMAITAMLCLGISAYLAVPAGAATEPSGVVNLVAYSTPQPAYQALISAFNKTPQGKNVTFAQSYGPSGSQSKAVIAGQPA